MASIAEMSDRRMSIGRVFSRAVGTIGAHPALMFGISFLFGALPGLRLNFGLQGVRASPETPFSAATALFSVVAGLLSIAFAAAIQTALYVDLREWKDGPADAALGEIFGWGITA